MLILRCNRWYVSELTATESLRLNGEILEEATETLCKYLEPRRIIPELRYKSVLDYGDVQDINGIRQDDAKIERLLEILKRKDTAAYGIFMDALKKINTTLYGGS